MNAANSIETRSASNQNTDKTRAINTLLRRTPHLWRGCDGSQLPDGGGPQGIATGYPELDAILPGRGWPENALVEVVAPVWGIGELQLLLPLMRSVISRNKWILWISPPYLLYAPALVRAGVNTERIIIVQPETACKDALWSIEKALQTESCGLVLAWQNWLSNKVIQRLQLAAETGNTLGVLFHHHDRSNSPSALRLQLKAPELAFTEQVQQSSQALQVQVLKARGSYRRQTTQINVI